ncbi:MAG TPA: hypothetical protein VN618_14930 [Solirubrobacteraceae bacterium]|nr:hypothetical protein [Solirubrobacteraceae bacterium]
MAEARDRAAASLKFLAQLTSTDIAVGQSGLILRTVQLGGVDVSLRPLNPALLIENPADYLAAMTEFEELISEVAEQHEPMTASRVAEVRATNAISRALYTTIQAQGFAMDCLLPANQSRKNFGMRFEELMEHLLASLGIGCKPITFGLTYQTAAGSEAKFSNQVDLVIAKGIVKSTPKQLDPSEVVVSLKTSSKDRFAKIFLDQEMLRFVTGQPVKVIAMFHNDVQRAGTTKTGWTFVAGNFAAYVERFGPLTGVYYVDPPPHINREPWSKYLRTFDDLLLCDLWTQVF